MLRTCACTKCCIRSHQAKGTPKERGRRAGPNVTRRGKSAVRDSTCPRVDARADTGSEVDSLSELLVVVKVVAVVVRLLAYC